MVDHQQHTARAAAGGPPALGEDALHRFIRDGFITVHSTLPLEFHAEMRQRAGAILDREGNWGNNILPRLPELQCIFDDPPVAGALASLLGPTYAMHPHRYCHRNERGSTAQRLHKDTREFSGDHHLRHHRPRWLIAFYYPQDVSADMGPTAVVPRSQYYLERPSENDWPEIQLCPPTGTVAIVHFGMWHRATANISPGPRYMFKFEFGRMDEPDTFADALAPAAPGAFDGDGNPAPHHAAWSHLRRWLHGDSGAHGHDSGSTEPGARVAGLLAPDVSTRRAATDALARQPMAARDALPALLECLGDADEPVRLNAAYALAAAGASAASAAGQVLRSSDGLTRRYAACALTAMGAPALETLTTLATDADDDVRIAALDALGDMGSPARPAAVVVGESLAAASPWVRRHAAEALGMLGADAAPALQGLATALADEQPYVRMNAATALARIGPAAAEVVPDLVRALDDEERYTRGWAALALRRVGTPAATSALLDHLMTSRWCATTTADNRY
jgi:HEAT repeat protein